jgi:NAD-dependent deacetylase
LHRAAGTSLEVLLELHGTIWRCRCLSCGFETPMQTQLDRVREGDPDPHCVLCGGIQRSATIAFGQSLDHEVMEAAYIAAEVCDLFLAVGSSLTVQPAAQLCALAKDSGARLVIVNADPTPYDPIADAVIPGRIGEVIPSLLSA